MSRVVVLGTGAVGGDVARELAALDPPPELIVADRDTAAATRLAEEIGAALRPVDVTDADSLAAAVAGAHVVFNSVGPFYRFGALVAHAAVAAGAHYVDICDEYDTAEALLADTALDAAARAAGLTVLTGMGSTPGMTNLAARWAAESLDRIDTVDVVIGVPYVVDMGVNVNDHMLHSMSGEVTQFLDGRAVSVPAWDDPRPFTFRAPYGTADYGYMGHPEAVTLGRFLPGVRDAVVRFRWFEDEAVELWRTFARLGLTDDTEIAGLGLSPRRFLAEYMASDPGRKNLAISAPEPRPGAVWQVRMDGSRGGEPTRVTVEGHMVYAREVASGTGNLTAVPAATGVAELLAGRITRRGVLAPEAAIDHAEEFVRDVAARTGVSLFHTVTAGADLAEA